jgi:hypothetical protein
MVKSSIENSGLLITRTLRRHKHQVRDFFNRHACLQQLRISKCRGETDDGLKKNGRHDYCSSAYPALASFKMGMSGSASFQRAKKSW